MRHRGGGSEWELTRTKEKSMKRVMMLLAVMLVLGAVVSNQVRGEENAFVGKWKLNVAKSKFEGGAAPKSLTRTVEAAGAGAKYAFEGVAADGSKIAYGFTSNYDGKDSAVTGSGMPMGADTSALKKVSSNKIEGALKKGGKELAKVEAEVSKDGKVTTVKISGKTAEGKDFTSVTVYDRE